MKLRRMLIRGVSVLVMGVAVLAPSRAVQAAPNPCPVNEVFCEDSCATICPSNCYQQVCWVADCWDSGELFPNWVQCYL